MEMDKVVHENREILRWKHEKKTQFNEKNRGIWKKQIKKYCKIQSPWPIGVHMKLWLTDFR